VPLVLLDFVVGIAFMVRTDPTPDRPVAGAEAAGSALWPLCVVGGLLVAGVWYALRGAPRVVLGALAAEARSYRRVRRCARLTVALAVLVSGTALAGLAPFGEPSDRFMVVFLVWAASLVVMFWLLVALRLTFGFGQQRPARAHPRDRLPV
jgi:hypothetical protein